MPNDIKEYKLYDVETKYGLLQVRVHTGLVKHFRNDHKYTSVDLWTDFYGVGYGVFSVLRMKLLFSHLILAVQ